MFGIFSWIKIGAVVALGLLVAASYWHYTSLVKERDQLMVRTAMQQVELVKWEQSWKQMKASLAEVERLRREAREYHDQITKLLAKHDLNKLAVAKPGLIEKRVNRATTVRIRVFECITDPECSGPADPAPGD